MHGTNAMAFPRPDPRSKHAPLYGAIIWLLIALAVASHWPGC
jgi:hypothetical protein